MYANAAPITLTTTALTAPTGANTVLLFDSYTASGGVSRFAALAGFPRMSWNFKHDQAGTFQLQSSRDGLTNWTTVHQQAMAGSATEEDTIDVFVAPYEFFRVNWVNGGVDQGTWIPRGTLTCENSPVQN